ncbi:uncharacterized protein LOC114268948 [Camellia sinensis]|uniref:uncharacterized protein LOC114268948 n=1 Tax=Camellia sinensis TaxID=4442 RepID=UPI0010362692|nr:uncharacterized protein LOC114268948 [Camellia sinensis]
MSFFNLSCVPILISLQLQHEMAVESAWIFDMDCYYQTLILARRIFVIGGTHMLKKINLTNPNQNEDIKLPSNTKAVKDLYVSPCGKLVLLASMGKKLSITSMGCNKVVISYNLPIRDLIWTCLVIWRADGSSFSMWASDVYKIPLRKKRIGPGIAHKDIKLSDLPKITQASGGSSTISSIASQHSHTSFF